MFYGTDYYPELWPREQWPRDLDLMVAAGLNVLRVGDLCWSTMEQEPSRYTFAWLDDALGLIQERGIRVVMCTPTASPPPWLVEEDPTVMPVDAQGRRLSYGSWGAHCYTSPALRERTRGIVTAMAERYGRHPAIIAWQIDNELDVHGKPCHCERCKAAFQGWLRVRYSSLAALNDAWGTACWSHIYTSWAQIPAPLDTLAVNEHNPGLRLDFRRFSSEQAVGYYRLQADILGQRAPGQWRTHNLPGRTLALDAQRFAPELDVVAWDNYPIWTNDPHAHPALTHDIVRGLKRKSFWILEQQVGTMDHRPYRAPHPGMLRLALFQAVAHGADAVLWFLWQTYRSGAEQYIVGLRDQAGRTTRFYDELAAAVRDLRAIEHMLDGSVVRAQVAILISYESLWALGLQPHTVGDASSWSYVEDCYGPLYRRNIPVDVLAVDADLTGYRVVVVPAPYLADEGLAARLSAYAAGGGVLVVTVRAGSKGVSNLWHDVPVPGPLTRLLGVSVREWDSLDTGEERQVDVTLPGGRQTCHATDWCEMLDPGDATPLARYLDGFYAGQVAATSRTHGAGQVLYVGARGAELLTAVLDYVLDLAGVRSLLAAPEGVEVAAREGDGRRLLFVLNDTTREQMVDLPTGCTDPVTAQPLAGPLHVAAWDARIVCQDLTLQRDIGRQGEG